MTGLSDGRTPVLAALIAVDAAGAVTAARHRIAGEPLGLGRSLDVRRPAVLLFWGTGLSAPIAALVGAAVVRRRTTALRVLGALFAVGALVEPVFWGRRLCPAYARVLLVAHVALGTALAVGAGPLGSRRRADPVTC